MSVRYPSSMVPAMRTPTITPNTPSNPKKTGSIGTSVCSPGLKFFKIDSFESALR